VRLIKGVCVSSGLLIGLLCVPAHADEAQISKTTNGLLPAVIIDGQASPNLSLTDEMARLHVPGVSLCVIHKGRIDWCRGFGVTQTGGRAITPDTLFQAGSVSKPVAAVGALRLVQQGRLKLDDDVNLTLKSWKVPQNGFTVQKPVTLRALLSHTAGTTVHGFQGYAKGEAVPAVVQVLSGSPPANSPAVVVDSPIGVAYRYSGGGYTIMQQLLIDATGKSFEQNLTDEVFKPFGMGKSTFTQPLDDARMSMAAMPHDAKGAPIAGGPHTYPELAAAGLWTTTPDLARFVIALQKATHGQSPYLSTELSRQMLTKGLGGWGLGLSIGGTAKAPYFYHDGSNAGYKATLLGYENGEGAVILTNGDQGFQLGLEILRGVSAAYDWPDFRPTVRKVISMDIAAQQAFAGTFSIPDVGEFEIRRDGDHLVAEIWKGVVDPLYPTEGSGFFITSQDLLLTFTNADMGHLTLGDYKADFKRVSASK
jgi:CubicO group peptidase (beta-lactamase class C family)